MNASTPSQRRVGIVVSGLAAAVSLLLAGGAGGAGSGQPTGFSPLNPPPNGVRRADSTWHALTNATVHVRPGLTLDNATVVIRDGRIVSVTGGAEGSDGVRRAPATPAGAGGARVWDATGLHIYPGFIDAHVEVDAPPPDANAPGVHWNERVMPQRSALDGAGVDEATASSLRRLGFTAAGIVPRGGVFRGQSAVVSLAKPAGDSSADRPPVYRERAYQGVAFDTTRRGGRGGGGEDPDVTRWSSYPNSQMGAIALIRQTLIDADWQVEARKSGAQFAANSLDHLAVGGGMASVRQRSAPGAEQVGTGRAAGGSMSVMQPEPRQPEPKPEPKQEQPRRGAGGAGSLWGGDGTYQPGRARDEGAGDGAPPVPEEREAVDPGEEESREPGDGLRALGGGGAGGGLPLLFDTDDELEALRAAKIAREFDREAMILGSGYEFRRLEAIRADGLPIVLPLRFPRTPDVAGIGKADGVELSDMMTWEQAPTNPRRLDAAGLKIALTTSKLRNRSEFEGNLTRAIKHGLSSERALAMLTTQPAELLGVADRLGTIEAGKVANLIVADGPLLIGFIGEEKKEDRDEERGTAGAGDNGEAGKDEQGDAPKVDESSKRGKIRDVWIDGFRHEISAAPVRDHVGRWQIFEVDGRPLDPAAPDAVTFTITRENQITYRREGKEARATNVRISENRIDYTIDGTLFGVDAVLLDTAVVEGDLMHGTTPMPSGILHRWSARRLEDAPAPALEGDPGRGGPERAPAPPAPDRGMAGAWLVTMADSPEEVSIEIGADNAVRVMVGGQSVVARDIMIEGNSVSFRLDGTLIGMEGMISVSAERDGDAMSGVADLPDEGEMAWTAVRQAAPEVEAVQPEAAPARRGRGVVGAGAPAERRNPEKDERAAIAAIPETYGYPFGPYMLVNKPEQKAVLFVNATIWTAGEDGTIENGWMFVKDGKISAIGRGGPPSRAGEVEVVDLGGKHIAPGIIDCHSHTGISKGVNESGQAVTSEVRIQDVTNPDAISWYRQLASGVTAVNNLHGSANAIGGQSQTNKIRWGAVHPDDMNMEGAMPGIKFALGENVKQSNWGDRNTVRYPQTRMGVETLIRDRFKAAAEYRKRFQHFENSSTAYGYINFINAAAREEYERRYLLPPRRDLELEALAEILAGERLVHCHSYRQDEILMLCRIAGEFGFKIGTFQHILEGYKVADEIAKHAIGASAFSDWWAFKVEVQDAIPQGGPIMWEEGVVVSFNSDSDELARRMNGEAAKAVKYSSPERPIDDHEALKFITLNPAIQLGVGDRIGSLEVGKDADFAIWSGSPLSSLSRCEATYVDGRRLFSLEDDREHRKTIQRERQRLIQKILAEHRRAPAAAGGGGGEGGRDGPRRRPTEELSARQSMMRDYYLDLINRGIDPTAARPGDCGCDELDFHSHW
jgi:imidazolonepropionase-like amidohydrolase